MKGAQKYMYIRNRLFQMNIVIPPRRAVSEGVNSTVRLGPMEVKLHYCLITS